MPYARTEHRGPVHSLYSEALTGWRGEAACRDEQDPELFLSDRSLPRSNPSSPTLALALAICAGCPVRRQCLTDALSPIVIQIDREDAQPLQIYGAMSGVWGGATEDDRHAAQSLGLDVDTVVDVLEATFDERLTQAVGAALAQPAEQGYRGRRRRLREMVDAWEADEEAVVA